MKKFFQTDKGEINLLEKDGIIEISIDSGSYSELLPLVEEGASWEVFAFANIFTKLNGQSLP